MCTEGLSIFSVGGCVRDQLLGIRPNDHDFVVVGATQDEMLARGFKLVGADFGVFLHPETGDEFALARTERKTAAGHTGFTVHASPDVTLEEDLSRRDLTINAVAMAADGSIVDPFDGQADLAAGVLRHVTDAFSEDPLRVLRVARFAARLGFSVAPETMALMRDIVVAGEVDALTPERVLAETHKALMTDQPSRFFMVLRECGALATVFPEIDALFDVPQVAEHHPEVCTGVHTLMAVDQAARMQTDLETRWAVLLHDLGKALSPAETLPAHHGHESAGVPVVEHFCRRFKTSAAIRKLAMRVAEFHTHCHRANELAPKTAVKVFMQVDAFRQPEAFERFLMACVADARGRKGFEDRDYPQADVMRRMFSAAAAVSAKELAAAGLTGRVIAEQLHKRRIGAVRKAQAAL